jgi:hypothetical protein
VGIIFGVGWFVVNWRIRETSRIGRDGLKMVNKFEGILCYAVVLFYLVEGLRNFWH